MINLHVSNEAMVHRGPNAGKLFNENKTGLGHRRLAIIDLSSDGVQPMNDASERYTIVFNGEIFNFQSLREELLAKGVKFNSSTDTEVLLYLYIHEGEKCLDRLQGFFAFAVYDNREDSLFVARDRMGVKPLLYYLDEDKLLFASEMNSILAYKVPKQVDYTSVYQYFQLHYIPAPYTIFKNIYKLLPGHYIKVKGRQVDIKQYYTPPQLFTNGSYKSTSYDAAKKQLVDLLDDSVKSRLIADVEIGAFLSGGIDSSVVTAIASKYTQNLNTFSIGYKDEPFFDETRYAELVANKYQTNHTVFKLSNDDLFAAIFELLHFMGEPFADSSCIPFYILSKQTKRRATVALSGDGADEIFAGYNKYLGEFRARQGGLMANLVKSSLPLLEKLPRSRNSFFSNKVRQLHRFAEGMHRSPKERYWYLSSFMEEQAALGLFTDHIRPRIDQQEYLKRKTDILQHIKGEDFNEVLYTDVQLVLPNDMLHKVDSMSMANSLEVREPFMDYRLVDFAFSLPSDYKINGGMKKRILQDAFRHVLPKELYNRPKHGFDVPLAQGFKTELKNWINKDVFDNDFIEEQRIFDPAYIKNLKSLIFNGGSYDQNHVWALLVFQQWWKDLGLNIDDKFEE